MTKLNPVISQLGEFVTEERLKLFKSVLENRTRYITVVLEDIYQPHNASAVLRTADCFGIQDVHIIENRNEYNINPDVALGSNKWLNLIKHNKKSNNTLDVIDNLKKDGYRIVATTPHTNDVSLNEFDLLKGKVALFFGTELNGLSKPMLNNADEYLRIPMYGFTESFNISVSASIILNELTGILRKSNLPWHLSQNEKEIIILRWLMNSIKRSEPIFKELCKTYGLKPDSITEFL